MGKSNHDLANWGTKHSFLLEEFGPGGTMKRSTVKELKNFNQQKKMFGKNWIKMNKFDVEQRSSNINYVKQDLLEQYKSNKKSRKNTLNGTSFMNDPNYINPANQTNQDLSRLLNPNIFDKINKEGLDEDAKKEIRLRKEKKEKERLRKLNKVQGIYGVVGDVKKKFMIKKRSATPDSKADKSTNDIFSRNNLNDRSLMPNPNDRSALSRNSISNFKVTSAKKE